MIKLTEEERRGEMAHKHLFNTASHSALYHEFRPNYPRQVHQFIVDYLRKKVSRQ